MHEPRFFQTPSQFLNFPCPSRSLPVRVITKFSSKKIMLECEVKSGWVQFIEFIETRCSSAEFENWIAPIRLIESAHEETTLEVPNVFVQEYLLENFKEVLSRFSPFEGIRRTGHPIRSSPSDPPQHLLARRPNRDRRRSFDDLKLNPLYTFDNFIEGPIEPIRQIGGRRRRRPSGQVIQSPLHPWRCRPRQNPPSP